MIEFFHKHRSTVLGTFVSVLVAFSMLGFGAGFLAGNEQQAAITVNNTEIGFDEFYEQRRQLDARYRSMFGPNYYRIAEQLQLNLSQTTADTLISDHLLTTFTEKVGLAAGDELVAQTIQAELFPEGFSAAAYAAYLGQMGRTARQFQEEVREDLQRRLLRELVEDIAPPTRAEVNALITRALTTYDISYVALPVNPEAIADPAVEELQTYFNEHAAEFEQPEKVAYRYTVVDLKAFPDLVPVTKEEIELFYSDNIARFQEVAQREVKELLLDIPAESSEEERKKVREQAQQVVNELNAKKDPESVLKTLKIQKQWQNLGWINETSQKLKPAVAKRAFTLTPEESSALIELPGALHIIAVTGRKDARTKELAEVEGEIRQEIVNQAAPAFLLAKAQEIYDDWTKSGESLEVSAKKHGLTLQATEGSVPALKDPTPQLQGLTQRVISDTSSDKLVFDFLQSAFLVEVTERLESTVPALDVVRENVMKQFKMEKARNTTKERAEKLVQDKELLAKGLAEVAKSQSLGAIQEVKKISQKQPVRNELTGIGAVEKILSGEASLGVLPEAFEGRGKFYLVALNAINKPSQEEITQEFATYEAQAREEAGRTFLTSLINHEKARASIDVNQSVMGDN